MADDTPDQSRQKSAVILGRPAFEQLRKQVAAQARARRLARAARKMALRKQLVTRILNKDRERPYLRVIK
ncbi:MAG: hypothetical protein HKP57_01175 [Halobacteria archaeon]|nr:hypothetical protein [Halobacteria archaeon]